MTTSIEPTESKYPWKVTLSSFLGNTLEYYDFLVYGTAAAVVFPHVFFPQVEGFIGVLAAFATFAVGFFARPLGGFFFGRRGDMHGRKSTLVITLAIMGSCTFLIGLLPSYGQIGVWAPILLVLLRVAQGFAVGGEWGGAMIIVLESAPQKRRGFFSAWPNTGGFSAYILITVVFAFVYMLPQDEQRSWGWRIPFLLSAIVFAVAMWIRRSISETTIFEHAKQQTAELVAAERDAGTPAATLHRRGPLASAFIEDWRSLLLIIGLSMAIFLPYFLLTVFALSYGPNQLGIPKEKLNVIILIMAVLAFPAHGLFAKMSDRYGRRPVYFYGATVVFVTAFPFFWAMHTGSLILIAIAYVVVLNLGHNAMNAIQPAFYAELFTADRRYSGASAGREIASILGGGLTPFIATALAGSDGARWPLVAGYVMIGAALSMFAVWKAPETYRRDLSRIDTTLSASPQPREAV